MSVSLKIHCEQQDQYLAKLGKNHLKRTCGFVSRPQDGHLSSMKSLLAMWAGAGLQVLEDRSPHPAFELVGQDGGRPQTPPLPANSTAWGCIFIHPQILTRASPQVLRLPHTWPHPEVKVQCLA